tara:strand:- start:1440 stop:1703 length:264 start_codon:yes stop_codon:yes gene_type:complete
MALKTFNVDAEVYKEFSKHCKKEGISMSKRVEKFIRAEMEAIKKDTSSFRKRPSTSSENLDSGAEKVENKVIKEIKSNGEHSFGKFC